jgi:hypothetical protein
MPLVSSRQPAVLSPDGRASPGHGGAACVSAGLVAVPRSRLAVRAEAGSEGWCTAPIWLAWKAHHALAGRAGNLTAAEQARAARSCRFNMRIGSRGELINSLDCCGHLCAATGRPAEVVTTWAALSTLLRHQGLAEWPADAYRRQGPLRQGEQALGPAQAEVPRKAARR